MKSNEISTLVCSFEADAKECHAAAKIFHIPRQEMLYHHPMISYDCQVLRASLRVIGPVTIRPTSRPQILLSMELFARVFPIPATHVFPRTLADPIHGPPVEAGQLGLLFLSIRT